MSKNSSVDVNSNIELEADKAKVSPPPMYKVILNNDDYTPMDFVIEVLTKFFRMDSEKATQLMLNVHEKGRAIVWTGEREKAEMYVQQLQGYQLLAKMEKVSE